MFQRGVVLVYQLNDLLHIGQIAFAHARQERLVVLAVQQFPVRVFGETVSEIFRDVQMHAFTKEFTQPDEFAEPNGIVVRQMPQRE